MRAYDILTNRGVTRLCHFTKFQSLTHVLSSPDGILASDSIAPDTKNPNDEYRYDGRPNYVCCSVQYPNSWFLQKSMGKNSDCIFREWVILYIDLNILKHKRALFCPGNASKARGAFINENMDDINSIFSTHVPTHNHSRSDKMLPSCPTDGQAEILIEHNIPREYIKGIAVQNKDVAQRIYGMLRMLTIDYIPIYIVPDMFTSKWSFMVRNGQQPDELQFNCLEED